MVFFGLFAKVKRSLGTSKEGSHKGGMGKFGDVLWGEQLGHWFVSSSNKTRLWQLKHS